MCRELLQTHSICQFLCFGDPRDSLVLVQLIAQSKVLIRPSTRRQMVVVMLWSYRRLLVLSKLRKPRSNLRNYRALRC